MKAQRRVVRPATWWREVDLRVRAAVALDAAMGTAYEHAPTCACPTCELVGARLVELVERIEAEVRQVLVCEVVDELDEADA
jgi:hypothetical protein